MRGTRRISLGQEKGRVVRVITIIDGGLIKIIDGLSSKGLAA
jgi:hypothetical protein